jgi:outer membrane protein OmpA-like peptidoglycan-associated protein
MNWIKFIVVVGYLSVSDQVHLSAYGQTKRQTASVEGTASLEGTVIDATARQPIIGARISVKSQEGTLRAQQVVTTDGSFRFTLDPKQSYRITYEADGYEPYSEQQTFSSAKAVSLKKQPTALYRVGTKPATPVATGQNTDVTTNAPLRSATTAASVSQPAQGNVSSPAGQRVTPPKTLDAKVVYTPPLVVAPTGKATQLRAIQFVQSKAELLPDAEPALEQLLAFMRDKPTVEIELAGHTDNQGDFDKNVQLSKQRVELVKDYLVKNGIGPNRISTRGYGPTRPIASNNSEATRQLNRRVEMIVLKQ